MAQDAYYYYRGAKVPLKVVEGKAAHTASGVKGVAPYSSSIPCYTDDQGLEVWPTGYVSVKLKSACDAALLQKAARENGLEVVEQDPFMPLWWLLQCSDNTSMPVIDVATVCKNQACLLRPRPTLPAMVPKFPTTPTCISSGIYTMHKMKDMTST